MNRTAVQDKRLRDLEKAAQKPLTKDFQSYFQQFAISPTCPPSKQLLIRPGIASPARAWGIIMQESWIEQITCDFEDIVQTGMTCRFTNAGYYLPILLCYWGEWVAYRQFYAGTEFEITQVFDNVIGEEVATAAEAEAIIDSFLNGRDDPDPTRGFVEGWLYYRFTLTGVVLRNDGNVNVDGAILPVDKTNRGRSYLYRDIRFRMGLTS